MSHWPTLQGLHALTGRSPHDRAEHSMNRRLGHRARRQPVLAGSRADQDNRMGTVKLTDLVSNQRLGHSLSC